MKKTFVVLLAAVILAALLPIVEADEYQTYQEIVFVEEERDLLQDFTSEEYASYLGELGGRKMLGWKVYVVTKNEEVEFVSETKLKIFNNGYSTIKHDITLNSKVETKFQISASGSIGVKLSGKVKKFDGALDSSIKSEVSYSRTTSDSELYEFKIIVDPGTYVTIVMKGKGLVTNGVARNYLFWILTKEGGWETFTVTTEYYEIIKDKVG